MWHIVRHRLERPMLERGQYCNTAARAAASYAKGIAAKYDVHSAACKTTGNMWTRTFRAFEDAGTNIKLANTYKMAVIIAKTGKKKTDKVDDAQKMAQVLRMNMLLYAVVNILNNRSF